MYIILFLAIFWRRHDNQKKLGGKSPQCFWAIISNPNRKIKICSYFKWYSMIVSWFSLWKREWYDNYLTIISVAKGVANFRILFVLIFISTRCQLVSGFPCNQACSHSHLNLNNYRFLFNDIKTLLIDDLKQRISELQITFEMVFEKNPI